MQLTRQIIKNAIKEEVRDALVLTNNKIDALARETSEKFEKINTKIDKLTEIVVDFAGQVKKFDEEQVVMSGRLSDTVDRLVWNSRRRCCFLSSWL